MTDPSPSAVPSGEAEQVSLAELARLLRHVDHLEPEARRQLADLVEELDSALHGNKSEESAQHLAESVRQLAQALQTQHPENPITHAREQLEATVARTAAEVPVASGVARRLIDILADLGI